MSKFVKVVDANGSKIYLNINHVVSVRPQNHESFVDTGAVISYLAGAEIQSRLIAPGRDTDELLAAVGIPG